MYIYDFVALEDEKETELEQIRVLLDDSYMLIEGAVRL